ncbi:hypothetical protein PHLGIDRAFT_479298 [Phlebiopsis gigantea 11061_1 CR5-6]|uniref:Uncharacterized protein n=1 Tax=Phlebiopsis gigantea (strain 11061_1 CR5-6) TaxID=745531 RepID=A0A0C3RWI8_PHLG1|nr:hypothetical protein PHLGIDRAFT_479298 [Phlebiopsis gigantea 11061_1 CR5-6]
MQTHDAFWVKRWLMSEHRGPERTVVQECRLLPCSRLSAYELHSLNHSGWTSVRTTIMPSKRATPAQLSTPPRGQPHVVVRQASHPPVHHVRHAARCDVRTSPAFSRCFLFSANAHSLATSHTFFVLARDSLLYFGLVVTVVATNCFVRGLGRESLFAMFIPMTMIMSSIIGCRMVLNGYHIFLGIGFGIWYAATYFPVLAPVVVSENSLSSF